MEAHFNRVFSQDKSELNSINTASTTENDIEYSIRASKRRKKTSNTSYSQEQVDAILKDVEKDAKPVQILDARSLSTMITSLGKIIQLNALARSKYSDTPTKFMESEMQLHEELQKWTLLASYPLLYPQLIQQDGTLAMLLGLLTHENVDIRLDLINLLVELIGAIEDDIAMEILNVTKDLALNMITQGLLPLLITNLFQFDQEESNIENRNQISDDEEATGIFNILQIIENLIDMLPNVCIQLSSSTKIYTFLLDQVQKSRTWSQNKLYSSEILAIVLQADPKSRQSFLETEETKEDYVDMLLQAISVYRKKNPVDSDEEEFLENLFQALASLMLETSAQDRFRKLEGLELMLRCLKDKKLFVFPRACRILDLCTLKHPRNCERLVEIGGLRHLFPIFMGKKIIKSKGNKVERQKIEEHLASIFASLASLLNHDAKADAYNRFHAKFIENDMEKVDRLVDLFSSYNAQVVRFENEQLNDNEGDDDEEEIYLKKLDAGLFVLQRLAFVLAHLCWFSRKQFAYVQTKFYEQNLNIERLSDVLCEEIQMITLDENDQEMNKNINPGSDDENKKLMIHQLVLLVKTLEETDISKQK